MFSLLPGIWYHWLYIVVNRKFTCVDLYTGLFIENRRVCFFCMFIFRGWPQPRSYFNSKIFPINGMKQM